MWGNSVRGNCTPPTLQTNANIQPQDGLGGILLTTCTPLFQLPPLILGHWHQRRKHLQFNVYPPQNNPPPCPSGNYTGVSSCHRL